MLNIVSARKLWATIVTGLNDLSELTYGLQVVLGRLRALRGPYREDIASHLSLEAMALPDRGRFLPFTTSFCEQEGIASQWLHYGRNGTGCALAFDVAKLSLPWLALRQVLYDPAQQERVVDRILEATWSAASQMKSLGRVGQPGVQYLTHSAAYYLWEAAVCFKHRSFRDEREWRLVAQETVVPQDLTRFGGQNVDVKFRLTSSGRVVPYIEVDYDPLPVREIVLGYSAPQLEADAGLGIR
jgi:hypothetical protein